LQKTDNQNSAIFQRKSIKRVYNFEIMLNNFIYCIQGSTGHIFPAKIIILEAKNRLWQNHHFLHSILALQADGQFWVFWRVTKLNWLKSIALKTR